MTEVMTHPFNTGDGGAKPELEPSQRQLFTGVETAFRRAEQAAEKDRAVFDDLTEAKKTQIDLMVRDVKAGRLIIPEVADEDDRKLLYLAYSSAQDEARSQLRRQFDLDTKEPRNLQQRFVELVVLAPAVQKMAARLESINKLPKKGRSPQDKHDQTSLQYQLTDYQDALKEVLAAHDGSYTLDELAGWLSELGGIPRSQAEGLAERAEAELFQPAKNGRRKLFGRKK